MPLRLMHAMKFTLSLCYPCLLPVPARSGLGRTDRKNHLILSLLSLNMISPSSDTLCCAGRHACAGHDSHLRRRRHWAQALAVGTAHIVVLQGQ